LTRYSLTSGQSVLAFEPFGGGQYQVPGGHSQKGFWTLAAGFSARARERVRACGAAVIAAQNDRCRSVPD